MNKSTSAPAALPVSRAARAEQHVAVVRVQLPMLASQQHAIDEWRYENRVPTRSEAIRRLLDLGLKAGK
jgi:hypothetical protein